MAQRTIHYLFGERLCEKDFVKNRDRFLLGSVLPDAYTRREERLIAHFQNDSLKDRRYFDFDRFYEEYEKEIRDDDLYFGYYMHLVEDDFYREFFHTKEKIPRMRNEEDENRLHDDYHLLNAHIVEKYGISFDLSIPEEIEKEKICGIVSFDIKSFLKEMEGDFHETVKGKTVFIHEEMADRFIEDYLPLIIREAEAVYRGKRLFKASDYAWSTLK